MATGHYHPVLWEFLANNGIAPDTAFAVMPEEVGFMLAGGSLQQDGDEHWRLVQLYAGTHAFEGRERALDTTDDGDHFTQSAGWVAAISTNDFVDRAPVIKTLRWLAYDRFGYDPDFYFNEDANAHDQFGFVSRPGGEAIIL
jgi:hypothetical protein